MRRAAHRFRKDGDVLRLAANYGELASRETRPISRNTVAGRALTDRRTIHVHNPDESAAEFPESTTAVHQTRLATPLLRDDVVLGVIGIRRTDMRPFTESQIKLVETFADQAVIAIENVRLFKELDERTNELTRSVGELKALGEVGQVVSSTLDLEAVLTRIVSHAVQLSGTDGGAIYEYDEQSEEFLLRATDHMEEELINALRANPPRLGDGVVGRAAVSREPVRSLISSKSARMRRACASCWSASVFAPAWPFRCCAKTASSAAWWCGENRPASFAPKSSSF